MAINNQPRSFQQWPATVPSPYAPAPVSTTPPDFNLDAGTYGLTLTAGVWGTATLQKLLPNGTTYALINGGIIAGDGYTVLELPAGQYRLLLAGVTALVGEIARIASGVYR